MRMTVEDIAFILEARTQGFTWKAIGWAFSRHPESLRSAVYYAMHVGVARYPRAKKSQRSESLYTGTDVSYTSPPLNGHG